MLQAAAAAAAVLKDGPGHGMLRRGESERERKVESIFSAPCDTRKSK